MADDEMIFDSFGFRIKTNYVASFSVCGHIVEMGDLTYPYFYRRDPTTGNIASSYDYECPICGQLYELYHRHCILCRNVTYNNRYHHKECKMRSNCKDLSCGYAALPNNFGYCLKHMNAAIYEPIIAGLLEQILIDDLIYHVILPYLDIKNSYIF